MKYKLLIGLAMLMLVLNIGLADITEQVFNKEALQPKKFDPADVMIVSNGFYDLIVENNYGIGTYTVRTGSNHPATINAGGVKQNVLYGGASGYPWSTYLTVKSYTSNTNYYTRTGSPYPDSGCTGVQLDSKITSITEPSPTSVLCVWNITGPNDYLTIRQNTFVDGTTLDDSKVGITTTVKNTGADTVKIGIRYEWDIMIDGNDNSVFRTKNPEGPWLNTETQWSNIYYTHYEITNNQNNPIFYNLGTATGPSYFTPPPTPPDLLSYAAWYYSYWRAFNYTLLGLTGYDSAILYYWGDNLANAKILAPGDSIMVTQYLFTSLFTFTYQADNHIKNSNEVNYIGDNIYNLNGEGQTKTQNASSDSPAVYHIKIENDGNGSDGFVVNEVPDDTLQNWNVAYYDALVGGNNITSQVRGSGWSTGALNPGQFREIRMEVTPDASVPNGTSKTIDVMSTSINDNSKKDVVRTITTVSVQVVHDVAITDILVPSEPIVSCYDYQPAVLIHTSGASAPVPCSVLVKITRFPSRMISYCNVGVDTLHPIVEYEEWLYTMVNPGYDTVYLSSWHPYWWDIDWTQYPAYHLVYAEVRSVNDENPNNNRMLNQFTVDGRLNDLQMNWTGLLNGYEVIHDETIPNVSYNVASAVSRSEGSPTARFRSWVKIIREADNAVVYTRYKDVTMNGGTYYCIPYSTGWTATEPGSYIVRSWIEARPGVDVVAENSMWERKYYVTLPVTKANTNINPNVQSNFNNIPNTYKLLANNPNPFSKTTDIQWQIPEPTKVIISIYDATGKNIKTLVNDIHMAGYYNSTWDRTDANNKKVPAGIYFFEMKTDKYTARRKMVITN